MLSENKNQLAGAFFRKTIFVLKNIFIIQERTVESRVNYIKHLFNLFNFHFSLLIPSVTFSLALSVRPQSYFEKWKHRLSITSLLPVQEASPDNATALITFQIIKPNARISNKLYTFSFHSFPFKAALIQRVNCGAPT